MPEARYEDLDPLGRAASAPHCWNCGRPDTRVKVIDFELVVRGKRAGRWRLCGRCYERRRQEMWATDPLTVEDSPLSTAS